MVKDNLFYIVEWDREKKKTWSGTPYSLLNSLSTYYNIKDIDIKCHVSFWRKGVNKLIGHRTDFGVYLHKRQRRKLKQTIKKGENVFSFSEVLYNTDGYNCYIYIDLSVSYLYSIMPHKELFNVSGFSHIDSKYIKERLKTQNIFFESCSGIFTMSHWLKSFLVETCKITEDKVYYVGGGSNIDISRVRYDLKERNKILFIGRDYKRKGLPIVYDAFLKLKKMMPEAELHVAGPSQNPILGNLIDGYYFHGECSHETLSDLFNSCDVFCMPSYFEAFGLVFIEALSYGLPCIGRNIHEMPYIIEDGVTGILIKDDSTDFLSASMYNLLHDDKIFENVKRRKDFYAQHYSWENVAKNIHEVISQNM